MARRATCKVKVKGRAERGQGPKAQASMANVRAHLDSEGTGRAPAGPSAKEGGALSAVLKGFLGLLC